DRHRPAEPAVAPARQQTCKKQPAEQVIGMVAEHRARPCEDDHPAELQRALLRIKRAEQRQRGAGQEQAEQGRVFAQGAEKDDQIAPSVVERAERINPLIYIEHRVIVLFCRRSIALFMKMWRRWWCARSPADVSARKTPRPLSALPWRQSHTGASGIRISGPGAARARARAYVPRAGAAECHRRARWPRRQQAPDS